MVPSKARPTLARASVQALRGLALDMVEAAGSGHPGLPLGAAPMAYVLWRHHLRYAPAWPGWPNRDRFVLSAGHGSALLYALLYLSAQSSALKENNFLTTADLRQFRRYPGRTPGHPERGVTPGVEISTGPLGQGAGASVGFALAERAAAARFNGPGHRVVDHRTYALLSDGDIMEGVCHEAAAVAGTQKVAKLTWLYDSNDVTLSGPLRECANEDVAGRFSALGWHVQTIEDGDHDLAAIDAALRRAHSERGRPSLLIVRTTIGYGAGELAGSHRVHGAPLGPAATAACKRSLGLPPTSFAVAAAVRDHFAVIGRRKTAECRRWQQAMRRFARTHPALAAQYGTLQRAGPAARTATGGATADLAPEFLQPTLSTRDASEHCLRAMAPLWPALMGGDGDLAPSTKSTVPGAGRHIAYGVREHAMAAISNGLAAHESITPIAATFLAFSDYLRPALRMSALDRLSVIYLFTHDSVAVGEDGPTHQPVEQLMSLRAVPHVTVLRPADAHETWAAWQVLRARLAANKGPHVLVLSRQALPVLRPKPALARGAYVVAPGPRAPRSRAEVVLVATGSEVSLALQARQALHAWHGICAKVVSMPSWELFAEQSARYRRQVLGSQWGPRVCIEAGSPLGWERWAGPHGEIVAISEFGCSAQPAQAMARAGLTVAKVVAAARRSLKAAASSSR